MKYPRFIYVINVRNRGTYIGIACDVDKRVREHTYYTDKSQRELAEEMNKYGYDYWTIDVVNNQAEEYKEYEHINKALNLGLTLYNKNTKRMEIMI